LIRRTVPALRRAAIVSVAVYSVLCGVFLVWQLVTRDQVAALSTAQLGGMLALFLLPAATAAAWELDRRAMVRGTADEAECAVPAKAPREVAVHAHEPRGGEVGARSMPRHRRRVVQDTAELIQ
jgi:hypothetical protein